LQMSVPIITVDPVSTAAATVDPMIGTWAIIPIDGSRRRSSSRANHSKDHYRRPSAQKT
jgi:hypothetical protein